MEALENLLDETNTIPEDQRREFTQRFVNSVEDAVAQYIGGTHNAVEALDIAKRDQVRYAREYGVDPCSELFDAIVLYRLHMLTLN